MSLTAEQFEVLNPLLPTLRLPYCPFSPSPKQEFFLLREELEVFFGGSAGPGKSWSLLMAALQHVDRPGYKALLLRPSLTEFEQQGGLIEVSHDWLDGTEASWNGTRRRWTFPSRATLSFGYLANRSDLSQYKGAGVSFVGFDELTSFPDERLYKSMFRVLRQAKDTLPGVPLRMRSASNPGDVGHHWVKSRFVDPASREEGALFVPARMGDNPYLDVEAYLRSLAHMHPVDRQRLIDGDWDVAEEGSKFRRQHFKLVEPDEPQPPVKEVRYWDLAATEPSATNPDPDWTVGVRYEVDRAGTFTVRHIVRGRWPDHDVEEKVRSTAEEDGHDVSVYVEQDPGQAGKALLNHYKRKVLRGFACHAGSTRVNGRNAAKEVRARPVAAAVGNGLVQVVRGANVREFLDEVCMFPNAAHDDCVDALSGAHTALTGGGGARIVSAASPAAARIPNVTERLRVEDYAR